MAKFLTKLITQLEAGRSTLCVGLDSRYDRLPEEFREGRSVQEAVAAFNRAVVDLTHDLAMGYKMNLAFYAGFGAEGVQALRETTAYLRKEHPHLPLFADCKRSEMGESVEMVRREIFEDLGFDCVMVTPWFGFDTIKDYLSNPSHGVAVYVHDSNPSAFELQDLLVIGHAPLENRPDASTETLAAPVPLYEYLAGRLIPRWNTNGNVIVEAGLTYPKALRTVRRVIGDDIPLLVAGLGAQGGRAEDLRGLFGRGGARLFVNVSRAIIFPPRSTAAWADDVRAAAVHYRGVLDGARQMA